MAFLFGDSFDPYGSTGDLTDRYVATSGSFSSASLITGTAFGTGQALHGALASLPYPIAMFPSNEATIYGSIRLRFPFTVASATSRFSLTFADGASSQCTLSWYGDGSVSVLSGGTAGTALAGLTAGAFAMNTWDSWQFKLLVDATAGSIELRKNGSSSPVLIASGLNTRAGSANSYVNQMTLTTAGPSGIFDVDDLFLCSGSGAVPNTWPGDLRAVQQVPSATVQAQFVPTEPVLVQGSSSTSWTASVAPNQAYFSPVSTGVIYGTLASFAANIATAATGHARMALYDATGVGGGAGTLLATSDAVTNPPAGIVTFPFSGGSVPIAKGTTYWVGVLSDVTLSVKGGGSVTYDFLTAAYAGGFPASAAGFSSTIVNGLNSAGINVNGSNDITLVSSDGDATYVTSTISGAEDIYTLSAVPTSYAVVGVTYLVQWQKPDVGPRTAALMLSANGSADTALLSDATLPNSYVLDQAFLGLDPTGVAWTPTTVNGAKLGIKITV